MGSTARTPAMVFISTGKNAPRAMRNSAGGLPRPNQRMASGMKAMGGMGRRSCSTGLRRWWTTGHEPMASPSGRARPAPSANPAAMRSSEAAASRGSSPEHAQRSHGPPAYGVAGVR